MTGVAPYHDHPGGVEKTQLFPLSARQRHRRRGCRHLTLRNRRWETQKSRPTRGFLWGYPVSLASKKWGRRKNVSPKPAASCFSRQTGRQRFYGRFSVFCIGEEYIFLQPHFFSPEKKRGRAPKKRGALAWSYLLVPARCFRSWPLQQALCAKWSKAESHCR